MKQSKLASFRNLRSTTKGFDEFKAIIIFFAFVFGLVMILFLGPGSAISSGMAEGTEVGKIAEKDIISDRAISYVDEKATALRLDAEEKLVLPIFVVDPKIGDAAMERYHSFQDLVLDISSAPFAPDSLYFQVQKEFPGVMSKRDIVAIASYPLRAQVFSNADALLVRFFEEGVVALPSTGLERFNPDYIELRRWNGTRLEGEEVSVAQIITTKSLGEILDKEIKTRKLSLPLAGYVASLTQSFVEENAFFDVVQSQHRLAAVRLRVDPVMRTIARGDHIIRKGFIVTEADFQRLKIGHRFFITGRLGEIVGGCRTLRPPFRHNPHSSRERGVRPKPREERVPPRRRPGPSSILWLRWP